MVVTEISTHGSQIVTTHTSPHLSSNNVEWVVVIFCFYIQMGSEVEVRRMFSGQKRTNSGFTLDLDDLVNRFNSGASDSLANPLSNDNIDAHFSHVFPM